MVTSWLPHGLRSSGYVVARSEIHLPVSEKPAPPLNEGLTALQREALEHLEKARQEGLSVSAYARHF